MAGASPTRHEGSVNDVTYSSAGALLSGGSDGRILRHSSPADSDGRLLARTDGAVSALYASPSSPELAIGLETGPIHRLAGDETTLSDTVPFHTGPVSTIAGAEGFDGVVSTSYDGTIGVWAAATFDLRQRLVGEGLAAVVGGAVAPSGDWFATSVLDSGITVWKGDPIHPTRTLETDSTFVDLGVTPDSAHLIAVAYDGTVVSWNSDLWSPHHRFATAVAGETPLAVHPAGNHVAVGGRESISVHSLDGTLTSRIDVAPPGVVSLAFAPDGTELAAGCEDGRVLSVDPALE